MDRVLKEFFGNGIVPVVALDDAKDAKPLAKALKNGGLSCVEVTFRTDAAEESIRTIANEIPDMMVGAGTVLTVNQVDSALEAGAEFIVSPGLNPEVVAYCADKKIPVFPGCANPSDIETAIGLGLDVVKFFPSEACGGLPAIKAMSAPYHNIKFMPTGGICQGNIKSYLDFKKIIACGGSWMASRAMINEKNWAGIEKLTKNAVAEMLGFTIKHIGINRDNEDEALTEGRKFACLFGEELDKKEKCFFAGPLVEMMKQNGRGAHGHIAIGVNSVERAVYHLKKRGFLLDESSGIYEEDGSLKLIYFKDEIAGFALHLAQN